MKKYISFIYAFLLVTLAFGQSADQAIDKVSGLLQDITTKKESSPATHSILIGKYDGYPMILGKGVNKENKVRAELTKDFHFILSENYSGLWVKHIDEKITPKNSIHTKLNTMAYFFEPTNAKSEFSKIEISQTSLLVQEMAGFGGVSIALTNNKGTGIYFLVDRQGGNPKFPSSNKPVQSGMTKYTGSTKDNTFGDFEVSWYPGSGTGSLIFEHVKNLFSIAKTGNTIEVTEGSKSPCIKINFENTKGKLRLSSIRVGNDFFDSSKINSAKQWISVSDDEALLKTLANTIYSLFKERYRQSDNYSLSFNNVKNGRGILLINDKGTAYCGNFKDGKFDGKGKVIYPTAVSKGNYKNNKREGYFVITRDDGSRSEGKYVNNERDGNWNIKDKTGYSYEVSYRNGKKISTTAAIVPPAAKSTPAKTKKRNTYINDQLKAGILALGKEAQQDWDDIGAVMKKALEMQKKGGHENAQMSLRQVDFKLGLIIDYSMADAKKHFKAALSEAKKINCSGQSEIKKMLDIADKTEQYLRLARQGVYDYVTYPLGANSKSSFQKLKDNYKKANETTQSLTEVVERYEKNPCLQAASTSSGSNTSTTGKNTRSGSSGSSNSSAAKTSSAKVGVGFKISGNSYSGFFRAGYPKQGWAARKAGITETIRIWEIDGKKLGKNLSKYQVEQMLLGEAGSSVKIKFGPWDKPELAKEYLLVRGEGGTAQAVNAPQKTKAISSSNSKSNPNSATSSSTTANSNIEVVYPAFAGAYEGDDLLLLIGRKINDLAVQGLLNDTEFGFKESTLRQPIGKRVFSSRQHSFNLEFRNEVLVKVIWSYTDMARFRYFKKKLPFGLQIQQSADQMKQQKDNWKFTPSTYSNEWTLNKYQLSFKVRSNPKSKKITVFEIEANDIKDWNSYYQQFE